MERILIDLGLLLIMFLVCIWKAEKTRQAYENLKEDNKKLEDKYKNLKNDTKFLQQENAYLKQLLNMNTDSVN